MIACLGRARQPSVPSSLIESVTYKVPELFAGEWAPSSSVTYGIPEAVDGDRDMSLN